MPDLLQPSCQRRRAASLVRLVPPAALAIFLVALSCSTACITMTAVDAVAARRRAAESAKVAHQIDERLRPLLPPNVHGSSENERLRVTGGDLWISVRIVGSLSGEDRARIENAARALYPSMLPPIARIAIEYLDDATTPPRPAGRTVITGPTPAPAAPSPVH